MWVVVPSWVTLSAIFIAAANWYIDEISQNAVPLVINGRIDHESFLSKNILPSPLQSTHNISLCNGTTSILNYRAQLKIMRAKNRTKMMNTEWKQTLAEVIPVVTAIVSDYAQSGRGRIMFRAAVGFIANTSTLAHLVRYSTLKCISQLFNEQPSQIACLKSGAGRG